MIGMPALYTLAGMGWGALAGGAWGFAYGTLAGIGATMGGLIAGGSIGCFLGGVPQRIDFLAGKFSGRHGFFAKVLYGLAYLLWIGVSVGLAVLPAIVLRAMRGHHG